MIRSTLRPLALAALLLPTASVAQQSFVSRLFTNTGQAVANQLTKSNEASHGGRVGGASNFAPETLDGYTHLRFGASALDQFGNTTNAMNNCDRELVGYALLHRSTLLPQDANRCISLEQLGTPGANMGTLETRMSRLAGTHRFYTRGTARVYVNAGPSGESIPAGTMLLVFGGDGAQPILGPGDADFLFVGANWFGPWSGPGQLANIYKITSSLDPSQRMRVANMGARSTVFFTVGEPKDVGASTWQRGHRMYHVPITVDKIILEDAQGQIVITPLSEPTH